MRNLLLLKHPAVVLTALQDSAGYVDTLPHVSPGNNLTNKRHSATFATAVLYATPLAVIKTKGNKMKEVEL